MKYRLIGVAALALVGTGVGLGVALTGHTAARPVVVRPVDQPIVVVTTTATVSAPVPSPSTVTVTTPVAAPTKEAVVSQPAEQQTIASDTPPVSPPETFIARSDIPPGAPIPPLISSPPSSDQALPVIPTPNN